MSYDPGISGISGASDVFLNNPASNDALSYNTAASKWENTPVDKTRVGLANVDNTSDVNKPVSTAQQTALNLKAPLASPTFTGTVTVPTPTNNTDATTKTYVDTADSSTNTAVTAYKNQLTLFVYADSLTTWPTVASVMMAQGVTVRPRVIFDSADYVGHSAPTEMVAGDHWKERIS